MLQRTLREPVSLKGIGVHSGADVSVSVAPGTQGVRFHRDGGSVAASWRNVSATRLATVIEAGGTRVMTVEHLMSALSALGVWNADVTLEGPELPIMDGSARPFLDALAPLVADAGRVAPFRVLRPVSVSDGDAFAALLPSNTQRFDVGIDFAAPVIGLSRVTFELGRDDYARDIAPARTFGPLKDVERMRRKGYARGASLDNAVAVDGDRVANPEGLRFSDEFARHKLLDAIGDLALAGAPILGVYRSHKAGHRLNYRLLAALFGSNENFTIDR
ncbi:UDP-3-O-acyl-N-acetylglucosamine deacetylase [Acuticoccus sp. MNP-M23]|uniref:UDP-3-O-acyl-N-acetylglucosamine deacetylase n=1 Tax=Acuticoccus sp. MNP-M23 TaxID=3072793 RepID=UPI00281649FF|nr:UDP-3-O-acyl-N-acetylglucosamine deacetylase [Acuticoccus sp. MNP-M23]WMS45062.1 UDP-3-O-acyl-N-acetylglucosamine deacetylase [Acuticoccus sp. MNP-M23]